MKNVHIYRIIKICIYIYNLLDFLDKFSIGPIYYEYASMVIIYDNLDAAVRALYVLRETNNPDNKKPFTGIFMIYIYIFFFF